MLRQSALLLLLLARCSQALLLAPHGDRVEVASTTEGAAIAPLGSGGFVVAYEDVNGTRVSACVYDVDGTQVVPEFQLNTDTTAGSGERSVKVSGLANGGFVAVWRSRNASTVVGRTFSGQGVGTSDEFVVTRAAQQTPDHQVVGLVGGSIAFAWTEEGVGVLCNVFTPSGDALYATPVVVNPWAAFNYSSPGEVNAVEVVGVVSLGNGGFAVGIDKMAYCDAGFSDNVMGHIVEVLTEAARPVQLLQTYWMVSYDGTKKKMYSVGGGLSLASNADGFVVASVDNILSPLGAIAAYANNGTMLGAQDWTVHPTYGYSIDMFPSGELFLTDERTYLDGFGKNYTVLLTGQVFGAAANHTFDAIGNASLVSVSNVETRFVADTAILSDTRVVVVGDTNYHGSARVFFQLYDVRGLTADTAAPDTAAPQTHANTTAPSTTVSPVSVDTRQPAAANDTTTPETPVPEAATPVPVTPQPASVPSTAAPQAHRNTTAPETSAPHANTTAPSTTASPVSVDTRQPAAITDSPIPDTPAPHAGAATGSPDLQTAQPSASPEQPATAAPRSDETSAPQEGGPSAAPSKGAGNSESDKEGHVITDAGIVALVLAGLCLFACGAVVGLCAGKRRASSSHVGHNAFMGPSVTELECEHVAMVAA